MTLRKTHLGSALLVALAASQLGATDCGQITSDPGFDLWCGESLCAWTLERGAVQRVATWNEGDPGVELVGPDSAIQQLTPVTSFDGTCIEFDLIADVDASSQVYLNVDVDDDGVLEQMEQIPTSNWKPLSYAILVQAPYSGIRFELAKRGTGHAVLAQIRAHLADDNLCLGLAPLVTGPQVDGEPCNTGADCASSLCTTSPFVVPFTPGFFGGPGICESCDGDASCGSGEVCGATAGASPVRAVPTACVAKGSAPLAAQCVSGPECASGICAAGFCSTCDSGSAGCANGEVCHRAWELGGIGYGPTECDPGAGERAPGEACITDADCRSATCTGVPRGACTDGRECASDADCPFGTDDVTALHHGDCATVGVQGGTCQ